MGNSPTPALVSEPVGTRRKWLRIALATVVAALLAFFLPPFINANRFKGRIVSSMEQALGRHVTAGNVSLRLLPEPGFALQNVVISEDPAFGAEPMLHAEQVTARMRLMSLWRGRIEVARLDLQYPSLNLVRAKDGRWNIETLLERTSHTPSAPTTQSHAESRPRFPYIGCESGRINFKVGEEKKVYALSEADFALWLASENEWAFRLSARPVRTDSNLSDTGVLKVNGRFHRAASLRETPLEVNATVEDAQLGQLTKLIYGRDRGWRGALQANVTMTGTPIGLTVTSRAAVREFRRYDINTTENLRLEARCSAKYSTATDQLTDMDCRMPLANGVVSARGNISQPIQPSAYDLSISAENVGVQALVAFARHAKKDIPEDLAAAGNMDAAITVRKAENAEPLWAGDGRTSGIVLHSSVLSSPLELPSVEFTLEGLGSEHFAQAAQQVRNARRRNAVPAQPEVLRAAIKTFAAPMGGSAPVDVSGWFNGESYELNIVGDTHIPRLFQVGRALGLRVPAYSVDGTAKLDLTVAGNWTGFATPVILGKAQLHSVTAPIPGMNAPVQMASANLVLNGDAATLQNISLRFPASTAVVSGWVRTARSCETVEQCPVQFDLTSDELSLDSLNRLFNPKLAKRPWYEMFSTGHVAGPLLTRVTATGRLTAARLVMHGFTANRVTASAKLAAGKLVLSDVRAEVFGGKHQGQWQADFSAAVPTYSGSGTLSAVAMPQVSTVMHDNWAAGSVDATYELSFAGLTAGQMADSAAGSASIDWRNGVLRHLTFSDSSGPLQFKRFTAQLELASGVVHMAESKMTTQSGIYAVSGTASLGRQLDMRLRNTTHAYTVVGPLERPKITASPTEEQAALKQ